MTPIRRIRFAVLLILAGLVGCSPAHDSKAAAEKEITSFAKQVDLEAMETWARSLVESGNPAQLRGKAMHIPQDLWKSKTHEDPSVEVIQFGVRGEWFVCVFFQFGAESYGLAIGSKNAQFGGKGFVYPYRPGMYYFCFWN